jgi:hypothetical protein
MLAVLKEPACAVKELGAGAFRFLFLRLRLGGRRMAAQSALKSSGTACTYTDFS